MGKPTGDKPTDGKPTGDKPTGGKPTGDKPTGDKPPVFGDDGKWTKCEEPAAVENGKVKCKKDQCMLKCGDGFMVNGSAKSKCIKNDDGTFAFNLEHVMHAQTKFARKWENQTSHLVANQLVVSQI